MKGPSAKSKQVYLILWLLCIFGSLSVLPYVLSLKEGMSLPSKLETLVLIVFQSAVLFGAVCYFCYKIVPRLDFNPFQYKGPFSRLALEAGGLGALAGTVIVLLDRWTFIGSLLHLESKGSRLYGLIGSFYGAFNEEVLTRLFIFSLLYLLICKCFKRVARKKKVVFWGVNLLTAAFFGALHLPAAAQLVPLSAFEVFRIMSLNMLGGLAFGWLYFTEGLWAAIIAHFVADIVLHVIAL